MQGIIRASARLLVMGGVMAALLVGAIAAGVGITTAIAIGIVGAGIIGLAGVVRRGPANASAAEQIAAMMAPPAPATAPAPTARPSAATAVDAMAPPADKPADPEAGMPRWRRPSLLEARRSDPTRQAPSYRIPMRFSDEESARLDLRVVRYAVVPVLDRPDEVLGQRVIDLEAGDEVHVADATGTFVEVVSPNGDRGWVHRTTLGPRPATTASAWPTTTSEADEALTAVLSARGLS